MSYCPGCAESEAKLRASEEARERAEQALAEAAKEISCAGPVAHRIRVLKREYGERVESLHGHLVTARAQLEKAERERAEADRHGWAVKWADAEEAKRKAEREREALREAVERARKYGCWDAPHWEYHVEASAWNALVALLGAGAPQGGEER